MRTDDLDQRQHNHHTRDERENRMQTAMMVTEEHSRLRATMDRLLHGLRRFMCAYPMRPDDDMPEHDVVWMTEFEAGPSKTILDANRAYPELWAHAIPADVCIVSRKALETLGLGKDTVNALAADGAYMVDLNAARFRAETEESQNRRRS